MTCLILMRHGNTFEDNEIPVQIGAKIDLPLTSFGLTQAKKMAKFLENENVSAIFTGGLKRQIESAEIVASQLGLNVQLAPVLNEIDYGPWEGLTSHEIAQKWPKEYAEWTNEAKWQNHIFCSSFEKHFQGLQSWLNTLKNNFKGKTVFGVTSNGLLSFFKNEKVKTGNYCVITLHKQETVIVRWNQSCSF